MSRKKEVRGSEELLVSRKYVRQSQIRIILHNLRKNKGAMIGLAIIVLLVLVSCFADVLFDYDTEIAGLDISQKLIRPCKEHIFGTDDLGRDIFKRVLYGARYSLGVGFAATMIGMVIGVIFGAIAGYYCGLAEDIIMRLNDVLSAVPCCQPPISPTAKLILFSLRLTTSMTDVKQRIILSETSFNHP